MAIVAGAEREGAAQDAPVVVPFAGHDHDWAALEAGAWLARGRDSCAAARRHAGRAARRPPGCQPAAGQRFARTAARRSASRRESVLADAGADGVLEASSDAAFVVAGLSGRWPKEGLGKARSDARARRRLPGPLRAPRGQPERPCAARGAHPLHLVAGRRLSASLEARIQLPALEIGVLEPVPPGESRSEPGFRLPESIASTSVWRRVSRPRRGPGAPRGVAIHAAFPLGATTRSVTVQSAGRSSSNVRCVLNVRRRSPRSKKRIDDRPFATRTSASWSPAKRNSREAAPRPAACRCGVCTPPRQPNRLVAAADDARTRRRARARPSSGSRLRRRRGRGPGSGRRARRGRRPARSSRCRGTRTRPIRRLHPAAARDGPERRLVELGRGRLVAVAEGQEARRRPARPPRADP